MMKKSIFLSLLVLIVLSVSAQASIIWDFNTTATSPVTHHQSGYFYVYNYFTNTKGIGGTPALQVEVPYEGVGKRHHGGGFELSNIAGWVPYSTTTGNTLNLSQDTAVYFSIIASNTSNFGVAFCVWDTTGQFFIAPGTRYLADSTLLIGSISSTAFQKVTWDIRKFHAYGYSTVYYSAVSTGKPPTLNQISALEWFFPTNPSYASGEGTTTGVLNFYIDNVGALAGPHITGIPYNDWSIFSESVISAPNDKSAVIKE
jgi:hypothetical protein